MPSLDLDALFFLAILTFFELAPFALPIILTKKIQKFNAD